MSSEVDAYLTHLGIEPPSGSELQHYGTKGMKWGVRNDDKLLGRSGNAPGVDPKQAARYSEETKRIHKELKKRGHTDLDAALLKGKYETPPEDNPTGGLSKNQKIAIGVGIGVVAVGVLGYASYKVGVKTSLLTDTRMKAYDNIADGLKINWDNDVSLSSGSVLKRISTVAESKVRDGGFFACYRDDDVNSYKAILPTFWQQWGVGSPLNGGYINHYKAAAEVKAPSGKETFGIFKGLMENDLDFRTGLGFTSERLASFPDEALHNIFKDYSAKWIDNDLPVNKAFFGAVKEKGYNALIDFNDAGKLGKTPLRVIDSSIFEIVQNESLSFNAMVDAAINWSSELIHYLFGGSMPIAADNYLAHLGIEIEDELCHYGRKGMKWGVTTAPSRLDSRDTDTAVTKKVKDDYNGLSDSQFQAKYATTKKTYAKRVEKHGDPYAKKNSEKDREILEARTRQGERASELQRQAFKTYTAEGEKAAAAAMRKYEKMELDALSNPDATTAMKMTKGEKIANGVNWAIVAAGLAVVVGTAITN